MGATRTERKIATDYSSTDVANDADWIRKIRIFPVLVRVLMAGLIPHRSAAKVGRLQYYG